MAETGRLEGIRRAHEFRASAHAAERTAATCVALPRAGSVSYSRGGGAGTSRAVARGDASRDRVRRSSDLNGLDASATVLRLRRCSVATVAIEREGPAMPASRRSTSPPDRKLPRSWCLSPNRRRVAEKSKGFPPPQELLVSLPALQALHARCKRNQFDSASIRGCSVARFTDAPHASKPASW